MKKSEEKFLGGYYAVVLVLILSFPPWTEKTIEGHTAFSGFNFIFSKYTYPAINIHGTFLFLEILVATLIFGAILYTNKDEK